MSDKFILGVIKELSEDEQKYSVIRIINLLVKYDYMYISLSDLIKLARREFLSD